MHRLQKLANALAILRQAESIEKLGDGKGLFGGLSSIYGAVSKGAKTIGGELTHAGHPILGSMAALAPAAGVGYLGVKAYQSQPVQNAIYRYQMRKAQQQSMQPGYY